MNAKKRYYHGGVAGLQVGDMVEPYSVTGKASWGNVNSPRYRRDKVYISSDFTTAVSYAESGTDRPSNTVYEVEPIGEIEADFHCPKYQCHCDRARVLRVIPVTDAEVKAADDSLETAFWLSVAAAAFVILFPPRLTASGPQNAESVAAQSARIDRVA